MNRQSAALLAAAVALSGCISTGGSPFDLIPLSEKVLMTAGATPQEKSSAPISVEELLQRARNTENGEQDTDAAEEVSSVIDLSGSGGALTGSALIAVGRFVDTAQGAQVWTVAVETSPLAEPFSPAAREAVAIASMLRRARFDVQMRRADRLQPEQVGLRAVGQAETAAKAGNGASS